MKNSYTTKLINLEGCKFDEEIFTNLQKAIKWASERTGEYKAIIQKNYNYMGMDGYSEETIEIQIKDGEVNGRKAI